MRRLAELRREYTGETDSTLLPAANQAAGAFSSDDRAIAREILGHNHVARLFGEDEFGVPLASLRRHVLPDAGSQGQQELESGIFTAVDGVVSYLRLRRPADLARPALVFRMIRPGPGELIVHLAGGALGPLLAEIMPRETDNGLVGVAGLRARLHRRHVELFLVDQPNASVHLSNISYRQWVAGLAFAEAVGPALGALRWLGNDAPPLVEAERDVVGAGRRVPGSVRLNSALLRRAGMFRDAMWWTTGAAGHQRTTVEWVAGPGVGRVVRLLSHPLFGLPGDLRMRSVDQDGLTLVEGGAGDFCDGCGDAGRAELSLRARPVPVDGPGRRDAGPAWTAWERALAVTNPSHPRLSGDAEVPKPGLARPGAERRDQPGCCGRAAGGVVSADGAVHQAAG